MVLIVSLVKMVKSVANIESENVVSQEFLDVVPLMEPKFRVILLKEGLAVL